MMYFCFTSFLKDCNARADMRVGVALFCLLLSFGTWAGPLTGQASKAIKPRPNLAATPSSTPQTKDDSLWQQLVNVTQQAGLLKLQLNAKGNRYQFDESIELDIELPPEAKDYYLNIVTVDSEDVGTVLFPNQFVPEENRQTGQKFTFPQKAGDFDFYAMAPAGKTLIAVFATKAPLNLYIDAEAKVVTNEHYTEDEMFALLTKERLQKITDLLRKENKNGVYAASIEFTTVDSKNLTTTP